MPINKDPEHGRACSNEERSQKKMFAFKFSSRKSVLKKHAADEIFRRKIRKSNFFRQCCGCVSGFDWIWIQEGENDPQK
jgi:hypothetical protein